MSQIFELKDPKIMGDEDPKFGFTFWSNTDGDFPVMFNSKQGNIMPGTRIMAEKATERTSKNGTNYLRLAGTKIEDSPQQTKVFEQKPEPTFEKAKEENKYQRDVTALALDVYRVVANIRGLPENAQDAAIFWDIVMSHTNELLGMIENVRNSGQASVPTPKVSDSEESRSASTAAEPSLRKEWDKAVAPNEGEDEPHM